MKEYSAAADSLPVLRQLVGKDVVWKAKVKKVVPPAQGKATGLVMLEMNPALRLGTWIIDWLNLESSPSDWQAWSQITGGQVVVFKTHLTGLTGDADSSPAMFFRMNAGNNFAKLFTTGGMLVDVVR